MRRSTPRTLLRTAAALLGPGLLLGALTASAQLPPHKPGTICVTPKLWCWANPPGQPGARCWCATPYGNVEGRLR